MLRSLRPQPPIWARSLAELPPPPTGDSGSNHALGGFQDTIDASRRLFFVGSNEHVAELLCALPMVRVNHVQVDTTGRMYFETSTLEAPPTVPTFYTAADPPAIFTRAQETAPSRVYLVRMGLNVPALVLDSRVTDDVSASNPSYWKVQSAAYSVVRLLDETIANGTGSPDFEGLMNLSGITPTAPGSDLEATMARALVRVHPSGNGAGDGPHCLIGNSDLLERLMQTDTAKSNSSCGFRYNLSSGLFVYHYLGVPFYRCPLPTDGNETTLFAANLGKTGLHLEYAYGSPETFGIAVDDILVNGTSPQTTYYVHGAWRLGVWEPEGLCKITGVDLS
ncbi:MAG: hypothetical protein HUU55_09990 [Myxococcales bacterium]|nr:hypothetical protein [Myxococcales bacterium]